jgi:saccharopine dehydrogenase (NAD+, L-lysine-forming)
VDVSDDWEATLELFALHDAARQAGITVIVGLGASPGVTNVLARHGANQLDRTEEIHTSWVMRGSDPGGPALSRHLLFSLPHRAFVFENGGMQEVRPFVDGRETLRFPELGEVDVYHIGHPEPFMLARTFPDLRYADDKATFLPATVNDMIIELGQVSRYAGAVRLNGHCVSPMDFAAACLNQTCKAMTDVPKTGALRTEVRGERCGRKVRLIYSAAGRIGIGTGVPASIGAHLLALGKITQRGVYPPEACIDPEWFLQAVTMRNIGDVVEEVIEE